MPSREAGTMPVGLGCHLVDQRRTERELLEEGKALEERIHEIETRLKLLEGREDELPCTICTGQVYQQSTVRAVREGLSARLIAHVDLYSTTHGRLMRLQQQIRRGESTGIHRFGFR
ncbi:uncharacterized protein LOC111081686 [Drosophila obscura]|uniref:uncharacterized protein LOC111081686 n=1 Tax=Drosophila obscura TaxID=7282 RepID=UPI001BB1384D|nr:uncharacterized protein LOC111081686 [Drosophila obscura]